MKALLVTFHSVKGDEQDVEHLPSGETCASNESQFNVTDPFLSQEPVRNGLSPSRPQTLSEAATGEGVNIEEIRGRATLTIVEVAKLLEVGRGTAYEAARRGEIPTWRIGRRLVVPVPALLRHLHASSADGEPPQEGGVWSPAGPGDPADQSSPIPPA